MAHNPPAPTPAALVLHLEANSVPELMDLMDAVMGSFDPNRISKIRYDEDGTQADLTIHPNKAEADAAAAPKPKQRVKKAQAEKDEPEAATQADAGDNTEAADQADAPTINAMQNLTPAEARDKGIGMVQVFFGANPNNLALINAISAKYAVAHFSAIPDEKAANFLADVIAMTNGTGAS